MKTVFYLISILSLFLIVACFDSEEHSNVDDGTVDIVGELTGDTIVVNNIVQDTGLLTFKEPLVFSFNANKGQSLGFQFFLLPEGKSRYSYDTKVINPRDSSVLDAHWGYNKIPQTGIYNIVFEFLPVDTSSLSEEELSELEKLSQRIAIKLTFYESIPEKYNGIWYKTYEAQSILGITKIDTASSVEDTWGLINVAGDTFTNYSVRKNTEDAYLDSMTYNSLEGDPFYSAHFSIEEDQLISKIKGPNGQSLTKYKRLKKPLTNIDWKPLTIKTEIPTNYLGNWYKSRIVYYEFEQDEEYMETKDYTLQETRECLSITADSIIGYRFDGFEIRRWAESISESAYDEYYYFHKGKLNLIDEFTVESFHADEFTKFSGPCPPKKWIDDTTSSH